MLSRIRAVRSETWSVQTFFCVLHLNSEFCTEKALRRHSLKFLRATNVHRNVCTPELISNAEKWRNTTEVSLFQKRTKLFWSLVNYVWLHLHSSQRRVKKLLGFWGYWVPKTYFCWCNHVAITLSQLAKDASIVPSFKFIPHVHQQANCCSEMFFWKFFERILFTLSDLQSCVVAFIEQVQNIEKWNWKASVVEVVSCFATVKARIQERQLDVHIKPS